MKSVDCGGLAYVAPLRFWHVTFYFPHNFYDYNLSDLSYIFRGSDTLI